MPVWKKCTADILFYDETPAFTNDEGYIVSLSDDGSIEVTYDDSEGTACYRGKDIGHGHFELADPERNGRASLHYFPNSHFMEGYWQEGDHPNIRGMWRIQLKD